MDNHEYQSLVLSCKQADVKLITRNIGKELEMYQASYDNLDQESQLSFRLILSIRQASKLNAFQKAARLDPDIKLKRQIYKDELQTKSILIVKSPLLAIENIFSYLRVSQLNPQQNQLKKNECISKAITNLIIKIMTNSNYQLFTSQATSIIIDQQKSELTVLFDITDLIGINLLMYGEAISLKDYQQIFELLTFQHLSQKGLGAFTYNLKVRSIAKILLQLCLGKKLRLFAEVCRTKGIELKKEDLFTIQRCRNYSRYLSEFFRTILSNRQFQQMILKLQVSKEVKYNEFLWQVFVEQRQLSWTQVIDLLVPQKNLVQEKLVLSDKLLSFQEIMNQLQTCRQRTLGKEYIQNLRQLGLYGQPKPLFIALMSQVTDFAQEAICYRNMNQLLYCRNNFDLSVRDQLFGFLLGLLGELTYLRPCLQARFYASSISELSSKQQDQEQMQLNDEPDILHWNMFLPEERKQLADSVQSIIQNFSKFQTRIFRSRFITQNYYSAGLRKLRKAFK